MPKLVRAKSYSRQAIERIRATINTAGAIADLWEIGHDKSVAPGVRVKALTALINKTMPDLIESNATITHQVAGTPAEQMAQLIRMLGRAAVAQRWPDLLERYESGAIDQIPAPAGALSAPEPLPGEVVHEGEDHAENA